MNGNNPPAAGVGVLRLTPPVAGRWGESQSVPGYPVPNPSGGPPFNLVMPTFQQPHPRRLLDRRHRLDQRHPARRGRRQFELVRPLPADHASATGVGEVGDLDFLDPAGAFLLPVERLRRYVTPGDINGTGRIKQWDGVNTQTGPDAGGDQWGRVEYSSYFRPPGLPGLVTPPTGGSHAQRGHLPLDEYRSLSDHPGHEQRPPQLQHPRATATRCTASRPSGSRT